MFFFSVREKETTNIIYAKYQGHMNSNKSKSCNGSINKLMRWKIEAELHVPVQQIQQQSRKLNLNPFSALIHMKFIPWTSDLKQTKK
jgi:hypothetical protein